MSDNPKEVKNIRYIGANGGSQNPIYTNDQFLGCQTSQGVVQAFLPPISAYGGQTDNVEINLSDFDNNAGTNNIIIFASAGNKINGAASITINTNGGAGRIIPISQNDWLYTTASSGGGAFANIADLGKVLFVSINGNDSTGTKGRIDLPFKTISAAIAASSASDLIYVFAGAFNESTLTPANLNFYFERGATLTNPAGDLFACGLFSNLTICGYGEFTALNTVFNGTGALILNWDIECDKINGGDTGIFCDEGTLKINARIVQSSNSYGITIRGTCVATMNIGTLDCSVTSTNIAAFFLRNHSLDLVQRKCVLNVGQILSNADGIWGAISVQNSENCLLELNADIVHNLSIPVTGWGGIFALNTAKVIYNGNASSNAAYGITLLDITGGITNMEFRSGQVICNAQTALRLASPNHYFKQYPNTILQSNADVSVVELGVGGYTGATAFGSLECWGLIKNTNSPSVSGHGINKGGAVKSDTTLRLNGCKIITDLSATVKSIFTSTFPQDIQVMSAYANAPVTAGVANIIAGTTYIVDPLLTDNPTL